MKTTITISKKIIWCVVFMTILSNFAIAQTAPYALSPKWMFGKQAGLDFTSGAPVVLAGNPINDAGQEASATMCDPNKNIVMYCNNSKIYNGTNVFFQNVNSNNGQSSTDGAVIVPDPSSPTNQFFLFSGNDLTGGSASGINFYHIRNTAGTLSVLAGPTNLATGVQVSEAMCAGTDGSGGYWIVAHTQSTQYWAWHVTTTGVNLTKVISNVVSTGGGGTGSIKISQCQNRIGSIAQNGSLDVYAWDKAAGQITGAALRSFPATTYNGGYGCEFSMDGSMFYFTSLSGNKIYQLDIALGSVYPYPGANGSSSNNTAEMGTLQLGPDNKIYVTNVDNFSNTTYIGVINLPNAATTGSNYLNNGFTLYTGASWGYPTIYRGIANIAFAYPSTPVISKTVSGCTVDFSYVFKTYFKDNITIQAGSEAWDFGDASATGTGATPTHTYPTGTNTYTVVLTFRDQSCGETWTATTTVTTSCAVAPVNLISFTGENSGGKTKLSWITSDEKNNDYFLVFKSSDGINFYPIGKVKGTNNPSDISTYEFIDPTATTVGISYYRLQQVDFDATATESPIISLNTASSAPSISPNPTNASFTVAMPYDKSTVVYVMDIIGKTVEVKQPEINSYSITLGESLAKGAYVVSIITNSESYFYKVIKE